MASGEPGSGQVLVPHWLSAEHREELGAVVRSALDGSQVHPVAAIHLQDVLTELHVAAARDVVWPASAARVRLATGWGQDVLPVRLSTEELASLLSLPTLDGHLRGLLAKGATA